MGKLLGNAHISSGSMSHHLRTAFMLISYREPEGAYRTKLGDQPDSKRLRTPTTLTAYFTFTQEKLQCEELLVLLLS